MNTVNNKSANDEIDFFELYIIICKSKYFVFTITLIFAIFSVFYSLSIPNQYTSSATLSIVSKNSSNMGLLSSYSGIASMAGINLPAQSGQDKSSLAITTIKSRSFIKHLINFDNVMPNIMASKTFDINKRIINFNEEIYDPIKKTWKLDTNNTNPSYLDVYKVYSDMVLIEEDRKSNLIYISVTHISPDFAKDFLFLIIKELNKLIKDNDFNESQDSLNYLKKQLSEPWQADIKKAINGLIQEQLQTQMLTNIRDEYILRTLDPPFIPEDKSSPKRSLICIIITITGFFFSIFIVLMRHYLFPRKNNFN